MRPARRFVVVLLIVGFSAVTIAQQHHVTLAPDAIVWQPLPREWIVGTLPKGVELTGQIAIIHGDPNKTGAPFIIRIKSPGNSVLPVHWHKFDEHVTVLSGVWCVGTGDKIDPRACTDMPAGSYIFLPRLMHHWAVTKDNVVEVHGIGPFRAYLVQSERK